MANAAVGGLLGAARGVMMLAGVLDAGVGERPQRRQRPAMHLHLLQACRSAPSLCPRRLRRAGPARAGARLPGVGVGAAARAGRGARAAAHQARREGRGGRAAEERRRPAQAGGRCATRPCAPPPCAALRAAALRCPEPARPALPRARPPCAAQSPPALRCPEPARHCPAPAGGALLDPIGNALQGLQDVSADLGGLASLAPLAPRLPSGGAALRSLAALGAFNKAAELFLAGGAAKGAAGAALVGTAEGAALGARLAALGADLQGLEAWLGASNTQALAEVAEALKDLGASAGEVLDVQDLGRQVGLGAWKGWGLGRPGWGAAAAPKRRPCVLQQPCAAPPAAQPPRPCLPACPRRCAAPSTTSSSCCPAS
jgi:hypothetical protein